MKKFANLFAVVAAAFAVIACAATLFSCEKKETSPIVGFWQHTGGTLYSPGGGSSSTSDYQLRFNSDGSGRFFGTSCSWKLQGENLNVFFMRTVSNPEFYSADYTVIELTGTRLVLQRKGSTATFKKQ